MFKLNIQDTFNVELPADPSQVNSPRQVTNACFSFVTPIKPSKPELIAFSDSVADMIGLKDKDIWTDYFTNIFSGKVVYPHSKPYAMCYGGHQFGHWAGQLGDGRAINLMEVENQNQRWMLQLKGAGKTPYSRTADGLAVLRSSIREYLCSEAMYHLGVPTTRALSLILSGDEVWRDMLYDGNGAFEKGAIVCRVAPTFIRFGNFQIFAARNDEKNLRLLTDYTIKHFFPHIDSLDTDAYYRFFQHVIDSTLDMILHWLRVGFVHGVMNTDNMSILGLTIDYGPYGWVDDYNPDWTPNTTDAQYRRYRFGDQGKIAQWNLVQLANALHPLMPDGDRLISMLRQFQIDYEVGYLRMMRKKLGLVIEQDNDHQIINELEDLLTIEETDMTIFFRNLAQYSKSYDLETHDKNLLKPIWDTFYSPDTISISNLEKWKNWIKNYVSRLEYEHFDDDTRAKSMNKTNPKYVLRNYMAQMAIDKANTGDYTLLKTLEKILQNPYDEQKEHQEWFAKRPDWAKNKIGCSALSCSS
jgi:uncharacterized protein YdiU (UPF0061 family)